MSEMAENREENDPSGQEDGIDHRPITYIYLTFETEVPVPSGLVTAASHPI